MTSDSTPTTYTVPVPVDKAGCRLDRLLADALTVLSRTRLKSLIDSGRVVRQADGTAVTSPATKTKPADVFIVTVPQAVPATPESQEIPLNVVYEDDDVIVVDKPAGLVVHPAAGNLDNTLVNALLHHCKGSLSGIGGVMRPGIVHRLDKDTSGIMVAAKNDTAHRFLSEQFATHTIERAYRAIVWGVPKTKQGTIEGNIGRSPTNRKKMAIVTHGGKPAITHFKVEKTFGTLASQVECRLETGRTHQIRVHMASVGHPVMGDPVYSGRFSRIRKGVPDAVRDVIVLHNRQALHAYLIGFRHPNFLEPLRLESELPLYFRELEDSFGSF